MTHAEQTLRARGFDINPETKTARLPNTGLVVEFGSVYLTARWRTNEWHGFDVGELLQRVGASLRTYAEAAGRCADAIDGGNHGDD